LNDLPALFETRGIDIHQCDGAFLETRSQQDITAKIAGEDQTAGTDECDLWHKPL
jgi:hypothetical protein